MKTANELAQEYFAKTPMERIHTTLQDYVYDYMNSKIEEVKNCLNENHKYLDGNQQALTLMDDIMEILK